MSSEVVGQSVEQLRELIDRAAADNELLSDGWTGKRTSPRRSLVIPVSIRLMSDEGPGPAHTHWLRDISDTGIGITSHYEFEEGQQMLVELCVNNTTWESCMKVMHRTETVSGYKLGLEVMGDPEHESALSKKLKDPTKTLQKSAREREWLSVAKTEIRKATRAYMLARRTWGLLGVSVQKQIADVIAKLPGEMATSSSDDRRTGDRRLTQCDTYIVVHGKPQWRQIPAQIVDVSEGGLRMSVSADEAGDDFRFEMGMAVVVGLGAEPEALWVPAEVVRCEKPRDDMQYLGIQFMTNKALQAFS